MTWMARMNWRATTICTSLAAALTASAAATAQDQPTPPPQPSEKQPAKQPAEEPAEQPAKQPPAPESKPGELRSIEEIRKGLERDDPASETTRVASPEQQVSVEFDPLAPPRGRLVPEGSYLMARAGRFTHTESLGVLHFLPDADPAQSRQQPQPMMMMPGRVTERIEANLHEVRTSGPVEVSGRVYVYEGRNYLMPTTNPFRTGTTVTTSRAGLVREGAFIVSRRGRISRSDTGGEWMVTFDSDKDGQMDPPMVLLPCRLLERLVRVAQSEGDAAKIIISGQVYAYHDVNYLLPTVMMRPVSSENLSP